MTLQYNHHYPHEPWMDIAACRNETVNEFFPDDGTSSKVLSNPYRICRTCLVEGPCLEYALRHNIQYGIWGGQSQRARKRIRAGRLRVQRTIPRLDTSQQAM